MIQLIHNDGRLRTMQDIERQVLRDAIEYCHGNIPDAARQLKIGRSTIYRKIKRDPTILVVMR